MKLKFTKYGDAGVLDDERVGFVVTQDCNLKFYAVYHTRIGEQGFFNRPKHVFWFYPKEVKRGDEIVLYTKNGEDKTIEENGHSVHFFYWRLNEPIFNKGEGLVLSEIEDWSVLSLEEEAVPKNE